jgi:hypothetical protein
LISKKTTTERRNACWARESRFKRLSLVLSCSSSVARLGAHLNSLSWRGAFTLFGVSVTPPTNERHICLLQPLHAHVLDLEVLCTAIGRQPEAKVAVFLLGF